MGACVPPAIRQRIQVATLSRRPPRFSAHPRRPSPPRPPASSRPGIPCASLHNPPEPPADRLRAGPPTRPAQSPTASRWTSPSPLREGGAGAGAGRTRIQLEMRPAGRMGGRPARALHLHSLSGARYRRAGGAARSPALTPRLACRGRAGPRSRTRSLQHWPARILTRRGAHDPAAGPGPSGLGHDGWRSDPSRRARRRPRVCVEGSCRRRGPAGAGGDAPAAGDGEMTLRLSRTPGELVKCSCAPVVNVDCQW